MRRKIAISLSLLSCILFLFTSCDRKCTGCNALQTCVKGTCECQQGYEGPNCDTLSSTRYIGNYQVTESYNPALPDGTTQTASPYYCTIAAYSASSGLTSSNVDQIYFSTLCPDLGLANVEGIINTIYMQIPNQTVGGGNITVGSNQATYNEEYNTMTVTYQISGSGFSTVVTAYFVKQ